MRANEFVREEMIDEMPLPADWDQSQYGPGSTFKKRLAYALERAKKLGTGSSRVATTIEYQGRPTVLKIAKNQKGLLQNSVEADILSDGYARQLGILIPIIDYDTQNREPTWIHTEMAQKADEFELCQAMRCYKLWDLINLAQSMLGADQFKQKPEYYIDRMRKSSLSEQDIEIFVEYANKLAELSSSFDIVLSDLSVPQNWGMFQGNPVVIDAGFNSNVLKQYRKH